jgi:hypothetical protein
MSSFALRPVLTPHHFEIAQNGRGYWVAKDKEGLIGGVFRTQKDALRFTLFEVAGDSACVRVFPRIALRSTEPNEGMNRIGANVALIRVDGYDDSSPKTSRENPPTQAGISSDRIGIPSITRLRVKTAVQPPSPNAPRSAPATVPEGK